MSLIDDLVLPEDMVKDRDYYEVIESHLSYLKNHATTSIQTVSLDLAAIYKGDFYGLLNSLHLDKKFHYLIMRVNGLLSSSDYDGKKIDLIRPSDSTMSEIITIYLSLEES